MHKNITMIRHKTIMTAITLLQILLFFTLTSCGSKKKIVEVHKKESRELRDRLEKQIDSLSKEIEYRNAIIDLSIEPVDPKIPNKAKFTKTETGFEYEGENSKVGYKEEEKDSTVIENKVSESEMSDKGENYSSKEDKKVDLEKEGEAVQWKWSIWGIALIVLCVIIVIFFGRIKSGVKKFKEWF